MYEKTQPTLWDTLNEYADIQDELLDTLQSFEYAEYELRNAMDDIRDQIESLQEHISKCYGTLRRYKVFPVSERPL